MRIMSMTLALALGLCIAVSGRTEAQQQKKRDRPRIDAAFFERMDGNRDGMVTVDEIPADRQEFAKRVFERLDGNKDGKLTREEYEAGIDRARTKAEALESPRAPTRSEERAPEGEPRSDMPRLPGVRPRGGEPIASRPPGPDLFRALDTDSDGKLSKRELAQAAEILMKFDLNSDGALAPAELAEGLRESRPAHPPEGASALPGTPPGRSAEGMIRRADKNGDGKLSKDEVPELLRERFDALDKNNDGLLEPDELAAVGERMRRLRQEGGAPGGFPSRPPTSSPPGRFGPGAINEANRERIADLLREHDKDADGRISSKEFGDGRGEEFKKLDADGDGYVTPDELARSQAPRENRSEGRGRRRPEAPAEPKREPDKP